MTARHKDAKLTCRYEELAVPEVHTGLVEDSEDLEDETCSVYYETAIPEIHMEGMLACAPAKEAQE